LVYQQLLMKIGSGSFGIVYKSKIFNLDTATKKLKYNDEDENSKNIKNELNLLKNCYNKNIVELLGYTKDDKYIYLIFDLIKGGDLNSLLKQNKLKDHQKLKILLGISEGMEYLHNLNILHRGKYLNYLKLKI
jgi:serine/threonine protein kinase